jgi:hypothetical protein
MNPGFPIPMYFPFQFAATGSHTSNEIWESLVGEEKATTRQKGTDTFKPAGVPNRPPVLGTSKSGGVFIEVADVIVTFGIFRAVKLSQDCWADAEAGTKKSAASTTRDRTKRCFIRIPPRSYRPFRFRLAPSR